MFGGGGVLGAGVALFEFHACLFFHCMVALCTTNSTGILRAFRSKM